MNSFSMAAIMSPTVKFGALMDSRIFKPRVQTIFEAVDKITPQFKAITGIDRMRAAMDTQAIRALQAVNPPGRA